MGSVVFFSLSMFFFGSAAHSKVELSHTVQVDMETPQVKSGAWSAKDMNKLVPVELKEVKESDDAGYVFNRVGDKALQYWMATPEVQGSTIGRASKQVDKAMKTETSLKTGTGKNKIDHKISFQVLALQSATKLEYKGYVNAAWNYDARQRASEVQLSERVWKNKDLTLSHTASNREDLSAVGVRWSW